MHVQCFWFSNHALTWINFFLVGEGAWLSLVQGTCWVFGFGPEIELECCMWSVTASCAFLLQMKITCCSSPSRSPFEFITLFRGIDHICTMGHVHSQLSQAQLCKSQVFSSIAVDLEQGYSYKSKVPRDTI